MQCFNLFAILTPHSLFRFKYRLCKYMIPYPHIDPIAIHFGATNYGIRWYALAYLTGFLGGWYYAGYLADLDRDRRPNREDIDNVLPLLVLGVIAGGRIGYVLFYNFGYYVQNPL